MRLHSNVAHPNGGILSNITARYCSNDGAEGQVRLLLHHGCNISRIAWGKKAVAGLCDKALP